MDVKYNYVDDVYWHMLNQIMSHGVSVTTRNSVVKRTSNLTFSFTSTPLISLRKTAWRSALKEMEWFLSGSTNINKLDPAVRPWWQPWANEHGEIYNNYGRQFRRYRDAYDDTFDQIYYLVDGIRDHPYSRRNAITTWNTADMADPITPITNCHGSFIQALVDPATNGLELTMIQRSADMILGVPHNWIQYWAFGMWLAQQSGRHLKSFAWHGIDCHIYEQHYEVANKLLSTANRAETPDLIMAPSNEFKAGAFLLSGPYTPINKDKLEMVV